MVLKYADKQAICSKINFNGTNEQLLEIVNEMVVVYYNTYEPFSTKLEYKNAIESGELPVTTIVSTIFDLIQAKQAPVMPEVEVEKTFDNLETHIPEAIPEDTEANLDDPVEDYIKESTLSLETQESDEISLELNDEDENVLEEEKN